MNQSTATDVRPSDVIHIETCGCVYQQIDVPDDVAIGQGWQRETPCGRLHGWVTTYEPASHRVSCSCRFAERVRSDAHADQVMQEHDQAHGVLLAAEAEGRLSA